MNAHVSQPSQPYTHTSPKLKFQRAQAKAKPNRRQQTTYDLQDQSDGIDELVDMLTLSVIVCMLCCHLMRCHARHALEEVAS